MRRRELEDGCKKMTVNCKLLNSKLPSQYPVGTELLTLAFEINKAGITPCLTESLHLLKKECHTQVTPLCSHMCCKTPLFLRRYVIWVKLILLENLPNGHIRRTLRKLFFLRFYSVQTFLLFQAVLQHLPSAKSNASIPINNLADQGETSKTYILI